MPAFYIPNIVKGIDGCYWMACGKCGRKFWKFKDDPVIQAVRIDGFGGTEIEIKCPSCKALNRMKI